MDNLQAVFPDVIQNLVACLIAAWLVWAFREFLYDLLRFFLFHPIQGCIIGLVYLLVYGVVGQSLGISYLVWNEEPVTRFFTSFGATLLLALIGINAFFLVPLPIEDQVNQRIDAALKRRAWGWNRIWFMPAENHWSEARQLSRFLQLVRVPFLALLALPSLLPGAFVCAAVPRFAPVVWTSRIVPHPSGIYGPWADSWSPDVDRNIPAWLMGAIVWNLGILLGVLFTEIGIKLGPGVNQRFVRPVRTYVRRQSWDFLKARMGGWTGYGGSRRAAPGRRMSRKHESLKGLDI